MKKKKRVGIAAMMKCVKYRCKYVYVRIYTHTCLFSQIKRKMSFVSENITYESEDVSPPVALVHTNSFQSICSIGSIMEEIERANKAHQDVLDDIVKNRCTEAKSESPPITLHISEDDSLFDDIPELSSPPRGKVNFSHSPHSRFRRYDAASPVEQPSVDILLIISRMKTLFIDPWTSENEEDLATPFSGFGYGVTHDDEYDNDDGGSLASANDFVGDRIKELDELMDSVII